MRGSSWRKTGLGAEVFLNHHFPATDIPKQARALYVRNLVRVIPDVNICRRRCCRPGRGGAPRHERRVLRSVSPVHLQYLKNMGVAASARSRSLRTARFGDWSPATTHAEADLLPTSAPPAARSPAASRVRSRRARRRDAYRERVRFAPSRTTSSPFCCAKARSTTRSRTTWATIMRMLDGDGVAVLRGRRPRGGRPLPGERGGAEACGMGGGHVDRHVSRPDHFGDSTRFRDDQRAVAPGLLAITISATEPWVVMWLRAEQVEVVNWAGNPHKPATVGPAASLTPRASFAAWSETVRGRARRWTIPEIEAAGRLRLAVMGVWQTRQIRELNRQLLITLDEKELLLRRRSSSRRSNHRVQNSLQLVSGFLRCRREHPRIPSCTSPSRKPGAGSWRSPWSIVVSTGPNRSSDRGGGLYRRASRRISSPRSATSGAAARARSSAGHASRRPGGVARPRADRARDQREQICIWRRGRAAPRHALRDRGPLPPRRRR